MYCRNCGKENLSTAKFCSGCGSVLMPEDMGSESREPTEQVNKEPVKTVSHRSLVWKIFIGLAIVIVVLAVGSYGTRAKNERAMAENVPQMIYEDSKETLTEYYDTVMPQSYAKGGYTYGCDYTSFEITKGSDDNTFNVTGELQIIDTTKEERPSYPVYIDGTIETDFFRKNYSVSWTFRVVTPPDVVDYNDFVGWFDEQPVDIYSAGLSIDPNGETLEISFGTYRGGSGTFNVSFSPEVTGLKFLDARSDLRRKKCSGMRRMMLYLPLSQPQILRTVKIPSIYKGWGSLKMWSL